MKVSDTIFYTTLTVFSVAVLLIVGLGLAKACEPGESREENVVEMWSNGIVPQSITGSLLTAFLAEGTLDVTAVEKPDELLAGQRQGGSTEFIVGIKDGCYVGIAKMSVAEFKSVLDRINP